MAKISVIMGSKSDLKSMDACIEILKKFSVEVEAKVVSAHRTPLRMYQYCEEVEKNNIDVIIAAAGGAAHLPGMVSSMTTVPVIGVPIKSSTLNGVDSLLSIVQMPYGVPVATMAIGDAGAKNAALMALRMIAIYDQKVKSEISEFMKNQTNAVLEDCEVEVC